ncbi:MAG: hypothetical protein HC813_03030 [Planctomycetes bacterium]|nr:hypothetical protein [Planctomycetota bacterium]
MRGVIVCLLAAAAFADRSHDLACAQGIREFNQLLIGSGGSIEGVRNAICANLKEASPKVAKSIRFQLDRGFDPKYGKEGDFLRCICQMLAAGGEEGINKLYKRYKSSGKREELRRYCAEALGECADEEALDPLLKMIHDDAPPVAAAAVKGSGAYAKTRQEKRKAAMRTLIDHYRKVTDGAAGKEAESKEMKLYLAVKPAMDEALGAFSGGEVLDSATAWDSWLRENMTKSWAD